MKLAFLGGTGPEGLGLALRFAKAGHEVLIGSRQLDRAEKAARAIQESVPQASCFGTLNETAAHQAELVLLTVPFEGQKGLLPTLREALGGKILVDTVVPLVIQKGSVSALLVEEGSAAEQAQALLPGTQVVGAFHNLSAKKLVDLEHPMNADVIIVSDHLEAKLVVMELAGQIDGVRAVDGGKLANARYVEDITALLLNINKNYKASTSVKIVGL